MWFGWTGFGLGALGCAFNVYCGAVRYGWHRLRGRPKAEFKYLSGFPLLGSLLLTVGWATWIRPLHSLSINLVAALLFIFDGLGLHCLIWVLVRDRFVRPPKDRLHSDSPWEGES